VEEARAVVRHNVVGTGALVVIALLWNGSSAAQKGAAGASRRERVKGDLSIDSRTILGITLRRSNLAEVQARLGRAKLWSDGDASTAESKVCYVTQEPNAVVLVFASNAEMAGPPENRVTDIRITKDVAYAERTKCLPLAISAEKVSTDSGLRLGLSQQGVRNILGPPRSATPSRWSYFWGIVRPLPVSDEHYSYWLSRKKECFEGLTPFVDVVSEIAVDFEGGTVTALSLRCMESIC
jgi:hypothetical protein